MFTVKLCKGLVTKLIEAQTVQIFPCGPKGSVISLPGSSVKFIQDDNGVEKVRGITTQNGGSDATFYISDEKDLTKFGFAEGVESWDCAYIENANGKTTETVHAYSLA